MIKIIIKHISTIILSFIAIFMFVLIINAVNDSHENKKQKCDAYPPKAKVKKKRPNPRYPRSYEMEEYEWYYIHEQEPPKGAYILVELNGNKLMNYMKMKVREGEGLGHIKRWRFLTPKEMKLENFLTKGKKLK